MKRIFLLFVMGILLSMTSCISTATVGAQTIDYYDDCVINGVTYPVLYVEQVPYYYYRERWVLIPNTYHPYIRHYTHPYTFRGYLPHGWRYNTHSYYHGNRPPMRPPHHNVYTPRHSGYNNHPRQFDRSNHDNRQANMRQNNNKPSRGGQPGVSHPRGGRR